MAAPATPAAAYRMLSVPAAVEQILAETEPLPAEEVPFHQALRHTLAADVRAAEPVPGFRASIKVRASALRGLAMAAECGAREHATRGRGVGPRGSCSGGLRRWRLEPRPTTTQLTPALQPRTAPRTPHRQDGYAVLSSDGPGEYEVAFEAFAGAAPRALQPGTVAYIGTGGPLPEGADAGEGTRGEGREGADAGEGQGVKGGTVPTRVREQGVKGGPAGGACGRRGCLVVQRRAPQQCSGAAGGGRRAPAEPTLVSARFLRPPLHWHYKS